MPRVYAALAILLMLSGSIASAASLTTSKSKSGSFIVTLSGEISLGDSDLLKVRIRKANDSGVTVSLIRLDSPGGSLLEGVKLADMIRFGKITTAVVGTSKCASACFIVFSAGVEKFADYAASIGVHGASE